jgi:hypothetical protein
MTDTTLARRNGHDADPDSTLALVAPAGGLAPLYDVAAAMHQMAQLQALVNTYLRPSSPGKTDGDYGIIPGTDKPTLLKSGADKLCDVYGLLPLYEELGVVEDWGTGLFAYRLRCRIVLKATGVQVGEGVGACNSRETKYQSTEWWNDKTQPPPPGQGYVEIQTRKGTAWKRKVPAENPADLINTILKMAKKRALVDAVLSVTRSSGLFTQDLEDYAPPAPALATPAQLERLTAGLTKLDLPLAEAVTLLGTHLTQDAARLLLTDLVARYKAQAADAGTVTPSGEPVNVATGEIVGEAHEVADVPNTAPVRQVVVAPGDGEAWAALAQVRQIDAETGMSADERRLRHELRQRFQTAVTACGRDLAKTDAAIVKKYHKAWALLTVEEQEHACEVMEAEAESVQG